MRFSKRMEHLKKSVFSTLNEERQKREVLGLPVYDFTIGSPDIQTFIGALSHANADKGFFVTTGMFSFEAEKMAIKHPIQLINRIDLAKLILEALNN